MEKGRELMIDYKKIGKVLILGGAVVGATFATVKTVKVKKEINTYNSKIKFKSIVKSYNDNFETDSLAIICSNVTIEFTDEALKENEGVLKILGVCSNIKILVPMDWEVKLNGEKEKSIIKACGVDCYEDSEIIEEVVEEDTVENKKILIINYKLKSAVVSIVSQSEYENDDECCDECCDEEVIEEVIEE